MIPAVRVRAELFKFVESVEQPLREKRAAAEKEKREYCRLVDRFVKIGMCAIVDAEQAGCNWAAGVEISQMSLTRFGRFGSF